MPPVPLLKPSQVVKAFENLGFEMRTKGSHHLFRKEGINEKVNLQKAGSKAKPYQVKQVRYLIVKYKLGGNLNA